MSLLLITPTNSPLSAALPDAPTLTFILDEKVPAHSELAAALYWFTAKIAVAAPRLVVIDADGFVALAAALSARFLGVPCLNAREPRDAMGQCVFQLSVARYADYSVEAAVRAVEGLAP